MRKNLIDVEAMEKGCLFVCLEIRCIEVEFEP